MFIIFSLHWYLLCFIVSHCFWFCVQLNRALHLSDTNRTTPHRLHATAYWVGHISRHHGVHLIAACVVMYPTSLQYCQAVIIKAVVVKDLSEFYFLYAEVSGHQTWEGRAGAIGGACIMTIWYIVIDPPTIAKDWSL